MKNVILSDLHIKEQDKDFFKDKKEELIKKEIKNIIKNKTEKVFMNGDTFNESSIKNHGYAVQFFISEILTPLLENNIEIHILIWNHERFGRSHVFSFLRGEISNTLIHIHDTISHVEMEDFNAIFIPFMYPWDKDVRTVIKLQDIVEKEIFQMVSDIKSKSKKPIIIFNHNMMSELPFDIWRELNLKFWEMNWVDFVFWGHIHKYEEFKVWEKVKWLYVWSFMKSFVYEEESEGYVQFDVKWNTISHKMIENKSFKYKKLEIDDAINFDETLITSNTVYDITFLYSTQNSDEMFISKVLTTIKEKWSYIKTSKTISKDADVHLSQVITLLTDEKTILKDFLRDNKKEIEKKHHEAYFDKLDQCLWMAILDEKIVIESDKKEDSKTLTSVKQVNRLNSIINKWLAL